MTICMQNHNLQACHPAAPRSPDLLSISSLRLEPSPLQRPAAGTACHLLQILTVDLAAHQSQPEWSVTNPAYDEATAETGAGS